MRNSITIHKIDEIENLYMIFGDNGGRFPHCHTFLFIEKGEITLIDPQCGRELLSQNLSSMGKSWRNIREFEERSKFSSWLYRIAINTCLDAQKKIKKHRELPFTDQYLKSQEPSIIQQDRTGNIDDELAAAIMQLSRNQRTAIILRYFHDQSIHDIAEVIGCSDATVRIHLHRAIQKLDILLTKRK